MTSHAQISQPSLLPIGLAGALAMASAMGFGRFSYTPILPGMISGLSLSASDAGLIAAGNFAGYLAGAVLAAYGWAGGRERRIALTALAATALLQFAMAASSAVFLFVAIRFFAGLASAFAMIFTSQIVLGHATARGSDHLQSAHFGGVGIGIAASSAVVALLALGLEDGGARWRIDWAVGGLVSLAVLAVAAALLPRPHGVARTAPEPPIAWTAPLVLSTVAYGLFGFGYVITATFVVAMARMGDAGPAIEFLTWFLAGIAAAVSIFAWRPVMRRFGLAAVFVAGLVVEAVGVLSTVVLPVPAAPLVGGTLLGATFMMITAYGLRIGRELSPASPRRAFSFMTAAFGVGQILGPLVAGFVAARTGSYVAPSLMGALALGLAVCVFAPAYRRVPR